MRKEIFRQLAECKEDEEDTLKRVKKDAFGLMHGNIFLRLTARDQKGFAGRK